jgi:hypothetical protein
LSQSENLAFRQAVRVKVDLKARFIEANDDFLVRVFARSSCSAGIAASFATKSAATLFAV